MPRRIESFTRFRSRRCRAGCSARRRCRSGCAHRADGDDMRQMRPGCAAGDRKAEIEEAPRERVRESDDMALDLPRVTRQQLCHRRIGGGAAEEVVVAEVEAPRAGCELDSRSRRGSLRARRRDRRRSARDTPAAAAPPTRGGSRESPCRRARAGPSASRPRAHRCWMRARRCASTPTDCAASTSSSTSRSRQALPSVSTSVRKPGANVTVDTVTTRVRASMASIIASMGMWPSRGGHRAHFDARSAAG